MEKKINIATVFSEKITDNPFKNKKEEFKMIFYGDNEDDFIDNSALIFTYQKEVIEKQSTLLLQHIVLNN